LRLTYVDYNDRYTQLPEAEDDLLPGELIALQQPEATETGKESARLIGELSLPWQKTVLRMVREIHDQVVGAQIEAAGDGAPLGLRKSQGPDHPVTPANGSSHRG
jgi:hypothetical protein